MIKTREISSKGFRNLKRGLILTISYFGSEAEIHNSLYKETTQFMIINFKEKNMDSFGI